MMKQIIGTVKCERIQGCYDPDFKGITLRHAEKKFGITMICRMRSDLAQELGMGTGEFYEVTLEAVVNPKTKGRT